MPISAEETVEQKPRRRSRIREAHEATVLSAAEGLFAMNGYNGTSIEAIADKAGMSKQNLLYYFPSKEVLYKRVLSNILSLWVDKMQLLEQQGKEPADMVRNYIQGKVEMSRTNPDASKVFAIEIINGAPYLKEYLQNHLLPVLEEDVKLVRSWIAEGRIDAVDPYHLFFLIWSATQTYADFSAQVSLSLGKDSLDDEDFQNAIDFLTHVIIKGLGMK
ncbi:TetR family transcriptional regulator C-terminal domain-containing protein [Marinobacterium stanieri]|uniref:Transcriptional regulator, TetR family n=1 Tax=Marinobacterium stanieri TaxID=49186 RepID=A0A1N6NVT5_9GAMM|nr:TetR family transcriptional regulator C-terminal domain-containing protein [Marinobacterium stanieri]SIP96191.1 transcriptional regulator, TetR family [Marinobacterium stanieri]